MPGRTCSYMPVMPAPPSNRLRVGDPYRPSLQASFDGRMRCHYGITARGATLRRRPPRGRRIANEGRTATAGGLARLHRPNRDADHLETVRGPRDIQAATDF